MAAVVQVDGVPELTHSEMQRRLTKWSQRGPAERAARLSACLDGRGDLAALFRTVVADSSRRQEERAQEEATRAVQAREAAELLKQQQAAAAAQPDCRAALPDAVGTLVYLELPLSQASVHEHACKWPHEFPDLALGDHRAVRRHTTHTIANARRHGAALSLRTVGFQLFRGAGVPMAPPPMCAGGSSAMREYTQRVEAFVLDKLREPSTFELRPGDRVHSAVAYNFAVRSSGGQRGGKGGAAQDVTQEQLPPQQAAVPVGKGVIADVHTDFTRASGPAVLRSLLSDAALARRASAGPHNAPLSASSAKCLFDPSRAEGRSAEPREAASELQGVVGAGAGAGAGVGGGRWRYLFLNVWSSMDRTHPVSEFDLALLHPRSWSRGGSTEDSAVKRKTQTIFPENYVLRAAAPDEQAAATPPPSAAEAAAKAAQAARDRGTSGARAPPARTDEYAYAHEWLHYPAMTADEALVFVNFDSDAAAPQFVMHGAFEAAEGAGEGLGAAASARRPRVSVEVRLLVLIERGDGDSGVSGVMHRAVVRSG